MKFNQFDFLRENLHRWYCLDNYTFKANELFFFFGSLLLVVYEYIMDQSDVYLCMQGTKK